MNRNKPSNKPHRNHAVIVKLKHVGPITAARWTGRQWQLTNGSTLQTKSIECWWPLPTEEQLDALHDYAVQGHKGEVAARMGPFFCGDDQKETGDE